MKLICWKFSSSHDLWTEIPYKEEPQGSIIKKYHSQDDINPFPQSLISATTIIKEAWTQGFFVLANPRCAKKEIEMDTIKFVIEQYVIEEFSYALPVINIYINDRDLIDLISEVEHKLFAADGEKIIRSNYIGYEVEHFERFHNEMLGRKTYLRSVLLTCTCTHAECNCIMANIAIEEQTVTWSDLRSPWFGGKTPSPFIDETEAQELDWQPLDYSGLGPFVFDRKQYLLALDKVTQEWRLQKPILPIQNHGSKKTFLGFNLFDSQDG